jgi:ABC-type transport system involved in cytochrome c biogenesis ATPase subunit
MAIETLESELKKFADKLPHSTKYLAEKIFSNNLISEDEIDNAYSYLLEELQLKVQTVKDKITINYNVLNTTSYKSNLFLFKLGNIKGVNALIENQTINFSPNLTIIYGTNGSGKSGYVRLFKKVFYSKSPEEILPNIHLNAEDKKIEAVFTFTSDSLEIPLQYSENLNNLEFKQFAVFDGKSVLPHLEQKNPFEFRPAGLSFFGRFTESIAQIEAKLKTDIDTKQSGYTLDNLVELFDGTSEIKTFIQTLNHQPNIDELNKFTPFSTDDISAKLEVDKRYEELLLASKSKQKSVKDLENIKTYLENKKKNIESINQYFTDEYLSKIKEAITVHLSNDKVAKTEGIENFSTDKIRGIDTQEWKNFIKAASDFAIVQNPEKNVYPQSGDSCLFCHQFLSDNAQRLISNYWAFIKSSAAENVKTSQQVLDKIKQELQKLNFEVFPEEDVSTIWLKDKYPALLTLFKQTLDEQKKLAISLIAEIEHKTVVIHTAITINIATEYKTFELAINTDIQMFNNDEQSNELQKLLVEKTKLTHKEKLNNHFEKFQTYIENQLWINKAQKANFPKLKLQITTEEKRLSDKYFNQKYIDCFNDECEKLNGHFGVEINYTGSAGKSKKQLKLKGRNPHSILSEGEQKVIAIADFMAEMQLSEANKGLIFDDPVSSLDESRKIEIAERFVKEAQNKQIIIFTHDLVFVSSLIGYCTDFDTQYDCHWIENSNGNPGQIWLNNAPSYEKKFRNSEMAMKYYTESKKDNCTPVDRESFLKSGFTALRTSYEVLVIHDLFKDVVQRFNERVSVDSLKNVHFDQTLINELLENFAQCCRYMEGHTHSDKYAYKKPEPDDLMGAITKYNNIKNNIKNLSKDKK